MRTVLRKLMLLYKRTMYFIAKHTTIMDEHKVVFESFQGRSYACNPKGIYEAMVRDKTYDNYSFVWAFRNLKKERNILNIERCQIVPYESFRYYKALAGAKYWVFNSNTRSFLKPKKQQVFVQTWHGTPLKKIGCDVVKDGNAVTKVSDIPKLYHREAKKISYMISPSKYCTEKLISAFDLEKYGKEKNVLETGYPRNDGLFLADEDKISAIKEKIGIAKEKKVLLYAPTFRDNKHSKETGFAVQCGIDFDLLKEQLKDEYVILFRTHYFIAKHLDLKAYEGFVYDVSEIEDVNELYLVSDILVTDYSSVFFDYANLKRPMFFLMYDYEEYKEQVRDLYFDIHTLPGPIVKNQDELVEAIKNYDEKLWSDAYEQFHNTYNYLDGKNCGQKVAKMIMN